ncbi:MAG: hypothetical protein QNL04_07545, partial [SAR324 cluster bacterium]|nr:hypothetical protein [SAR324 cluster bacterium]
MSSLVLELQQIADDSTIPVSSVLRKAFILSRKLGLTDLSSWINNELKGYQTMEEIPDYRITQGVLKALNPVHGWIPTQFNQHTQEAREKASVHHFRDSIAILESLSAKDQKGILVVTLNEDWHEYFRSIFDGDYRISLHINSTILQQIFSAIRTKILTWALDLEDADIRGEGFTFSIEEKEKASHVTYNIQNMNNSQIQSQSSGTQNLTNNNEVDWGKVQEQLKELSTNGFLKAIYGQIASLENLSKLSTSTDAAKQSPDAAKPTAKPN